MKSFKKILALVLCVVMLVSALPLGTFAFPVHTQDTIVEEAEYDYFYKYVFDEISEGTALNQWYSKAGADSNPYGFGYDSNGGISGVSMARYDENGNYMGNFVRATYGKTSGWHGTRFVMSKNGKSYTIGNTLSFEFDLRWHGVKDTSKINYSQTMALLRFRRSSNAPIKFLDAKVVAGQEMVDGQEVTVPDQYLRIYVPDGNTDSNKQTTLIEKDVITLDKSASDFVSFKVIYYDATQTFSIYIDNVLVVESQAAKNLKSEDLWLSSETFINYTYDDDGMITSREEKAGDNLSFTFARMDYSSASQTPCIIDVDNLYIREVELADGRTAYYENSFEGTIGNLVDGKLGGSTAYRYAETSGIKVGSETVNGKTNKFLTFAAGSRLNINDKYQIIQNGNWTLEFDVRATAEKDGLPIFRFYDNSNTPQLLTLKKDGTILFASGALTVPNIKMKPANSNEWTHIVMSVNVDEGGANRYVFDDWTKDMGNRSLTYTMALWVDGVFVGAYNNISRREFLFEKNWYDGRFINDRAYTRSLIANKTDVDVSGFKVVTDTATLKQYIDTATGDMYQLAYDSNGNFVPGSLVFTETALAEDKLPDFSKTANFKNTKDTDTEKIYEAIKTEGNYVKGDYFVVSYDENGNFVSCKFFDAQKSVTGSVKLDAGSVSHQDLWGFFHNNTTSKVSGAIDNIRIYEGVMPKEYAVGPNDQLGLVNNIEFASVNIASTNTAESTQNKNGGNVGVAKFSGWLTSNVTRKNDSVNDIDYVTVTTSNAEAFIDMCIPNVAGKVFSMEATLRNMVVPSNVDMFGVRRQMAGSTVNNMNRYLKVSNTGELAFARDGVNYFLCDADGNKYFVNTNEWVTIKIIVDESGDVPRVSYVINGEPAYCKGSNFPYAFMAVNIEGLVSAEQTSRIGAIDQRIRLLQSKNFTVDLKNFKCELVENPFPLWEDSAMIDFSDYDSIDDLSPQFYRSSGVTLENGVLTIPKGEVFAWIDYNNVFYKFLQNNNTTTDGFNVEMRAKTETTDGYVASLLYNTKKASMGYIDKSTQNILVGGQLVSNVHLNGLDSDEYNDISVTMWTKDETASVFVDGALVGVASSAVNEVKDTHHVAFRIASNTELTELYIHADLKRELSERRGQILKLDPDILAAADSGRYVTSGIINMNTLSKHTSISNMLVDEDGEGYYRWSFDTARTDHIFSDIYLTDYLEDHVTVFEYDVRFTPAAAATAENKGLFELASIRRTDTSGTGIFDSMLNITALGYISTPFGLLVDENGDELKVSSDKWQKLVVIYDADAGLASYRIGGQIPYYKSGDSVLLADKIQLKDVRGYRRNSLETRVRTASFNTGSLGTLDLKSIDIYQLDASANVEFVGVQKSTSERDIRLVAGLDMLYYGSVGFEVKAYDSNGAVISNGQTAYETNIVYSSIDEWIGENAKTIYPADYGYKYFATANVTGITSEEAVKLVVTPFTTVNDKKFYAASATIDLDFVEEAMTEWVCDTEFKQIKPAGDNINANFKTTEYVAYTNDGALEFNGLNAEFTFAADCEGEVSVNLTNAYGEVAESSKFDIYVDGTLAKEGVELAFGHHNLVLAENIENGTHTFKIVKRTGGDFVRINTMNICGELVAAPLLAREGAVNVIVHNASGIQELGNIDVFVQTSEASGDYYIRYNFDYERNNLNSYDYTNGVSNSQNNKSLYRIKGAELVKREGENYYSLVFDVLNTGEISLAMNERWNGVDAKDFVGGFHGDENLICVDFYLDGARIDPSKPGVYNNGTNFEMVQSTVINRCDTEETDVMNHNQKYLVNTNGIKLEQQVEFLVGDYGPREDLTFLQMATVYRVNWALRSAGATDDELNIDSNMVGAYANLLDANGTVRVEADLTADEYNYDRDLKNTTNVKVGKSTENRYIEYLGNPGGSYEGLYGLVGFVIDDGSVKVDSTRLDVRLKEGDNKWYASFDTYNGTTVPMGEIWNISNSYFLDYNPALYGAK